VPNFGRRYRWAEQGFVFGSFKIPLSKHKHAAWTDHRDFAEGEYKPVVRLQGGWHLLELKTCCAALALMLSTDKNRESE